MHYHVILLRVKRGRKYNLLRSEDVTKHEHLSLQPIDWLLSLLRHSQIKCPYIVAGLRFT